MTIEVAPLGMECGRGCEYCYQEPVRDAGNEGDGEYDMEAMKAGLRAEGFRFSLFGGEPLLVPMEDLEELFAFGKQEFGQAAAEHGVPPNGIQTDGYLITDEHIRMFRRYQVGVGVSIDGPGELNDARAMREGGIEATRKATAKSEAALEKMLRGGLRPSVISTLNRHNAVPDRLSRLLDWYEELADIGLRHVNLHLLEVDNPGVREQLALTEDETVAALMAAHELSKQSPLTFAPLSDMKHLLRGEDQWAEREGGGYSAGVNCTWNGCDPYTTDAVRSVDGQGNRRNCGRTYKDGVQKQKASVAGFERYLALYHTPMEYGGCQGCRFFYACGGHCPGESEQGDWRGKTEHCGVLMRVFGKLEAEMVAAGETPFSLTSERLDVEHAMVEQWKAGQRALITPTRKMLEAGEPVTGNGQAQQAHGDSPHGDSHGDSGDPEWRAANPEWVARHEAEHGKDESGGAP